jgi:large subunit ribosomal protein L1
MKKYSKRFKVLKNLIVKDSYSLEECVSLLKQTATAKFVESAEAHLCLNLDTKYSDQQLRTTIILPKGSGKKINIAVLLSDIGEKDKLFEYGANVVGSDDLIDEISKGNFNFDLLLTTPEMMPRLTKLGKLLGPRGLMPSTKTGTVTNNIYDALTEFKAGKVECRADKTGVVHILFGKSDFTSEDLLENLVAVFNSVKQNRPSGVKGRYFKSFKICTTMGPSLNIDLRTLLA